MKAWIKFKQNEKKKVYYRYEEDMKSLTFYTESVIDAPMFNMFSILAEVDLFKEWIPFMKVSELLL